MTTMRQPITVGACPCKEDPEPRAVGAEQTPGGPAESFGRYVPSGDLGPSWNNWNWNWLRFGPGWNRFLPAVLVINNYRAQFWTAHARPAGSFGPWSRITWQPPRSRAEVCALVASAAAASPSALEVAVTGWDSSMVREVERFRGSAASVLVQMGC